MTQSRQTQLRKIPGVDQLLETLQTNPEIAQVPRKVQAAAIRTVLEALRSEILEKGMNDNELKARLDTLASAVMDAVRAAVRHRLISTINATGVVIHTNLGRSVLCDEALENLARIAGGYSNMEYDLAAGKRGSRYSAVEPILCEVSGAEAAMVVNNNAAAVLLCLDTLAKGREVVVSRGELVEIGGSFRIPDVMAKSGALLREVGTSNRTHLHDYENAVSEDTALLMKVHKSNYSIVGFTKEVRLDELVRLGRAKGLPVMEDLGSGSFIDLSRYGLTREPTVQDSVAAGADVVTFSGDKLLGGPQAGLIVGRREIIDRIRKNPLNRALRIDKMTLAALESTLRRYRDPERAVLEIPTLRMITAPLHRMAEKAEHLARILRDVSPERVSVEAVEGFSRTGGGSLPLQKLATRCVALRIEGLSANAVERFLRENDPPVIVRIEADAVLFDPRTLETENFSVIEAAVSRILERSSNTTHG